MYPILFEINGVPIYAHGFFLNLALLVCLLVIIGEGRRRRWQKDEVVSTTLASLIRGMIRAGFPLIRGLRVGLLFATLVLTGCADATTPSLVPPALTPTSQVPGPITPENAGRVQQLAILGRGTISQLAWSPDGSSLAIAAYPGVWLYDTTALDASPRFLQGHTGRVWCVAFSPDGKTLASCGLDGTLRLWDIVTGEERIVLQDSAGFVNAVAISPDGKKVTSGVRLWEVATGAELGVLPGHTWIVFAITFSPDGAMLASGSSDGTVRLWTAPAEP